MKKQYSTHQAGELMNPPLLTNFNQALQDSLESIYASRKASLGHAKALNIHSEMLQKSNRNGNRSEDTVDEALHRSSRKTGCSVYTDAFSSPERTLNAAVAPAGLKVTSYDSYDKEMNNIHAGCGDGSPIIPTGDRDKNKNDKNTVNELKPRPLMGSGDSYKPGVTLKYTVENYLNDYKTSSSNIGNHNYPVLVKPAGIPSVRNDLQEPKVRSITDFNDYGDIKDGSTIIQPDIFEKYGVHDHDLCSFRSKQEMQMLDRII